MKAESISKILLEAEQGKSVGWFPTQENTLVCWRKDTNTGEITMYECVGGTLKGNTLNSPVEFNVKPTKVSSKAN